MMAANIYHSGQGAQKTICRRKLFGKMFGKIPNWRQHCVEIGHRDRKMRQPQDKTKHLSSAVSGVPQLIAPQRWMIVAVQAK